MCMQGVVDSRSVERWVGAVGCITVLVVCGSVRYFGSPRQEMLPFLLAAPTAEDAADALSAVADGCDGERLLDVLADAVRGVDAAVARRRRVEYERMLRSLKDPHGREAYALTCIVSACLLAEGAASSSWFSYCWTLLPSWR